MAQTGVMWWKSGLEFMKAYLDEILYTVAIISKYEPNTNLQIIVTVISYNNCSYCAIVGTNTAC